MSNQNEEREYQVSIFEECWGDYFEGYVCCSGFGCCCNGTENLPAFLKHIRESLDKAERRGELKAYNDVLKQEDEMHTTLKLEETPMKEFDRGYIQYQDWVLNIMKYVRDAITKIDKQYEKNNLR